MKHQIDLTNFDISGYLENENDFTYLPSYKINTIYFFIYFIILWSFCIYPNVHKNTQFAFNIDRLRKKVLPRLYECLTSEICQMTIARYRKIPTIFIVRLLSTFKIRGM